MDLKGWLPQGQYCHSRATGQQAFVAESWQPSSGVDCRAQVLSDFGCLLCRVQVAENMQKGDVGTREREAAGQKAMTKLNTEAATRLAQLEADTQISQATIKSQSSVAANKASIEAKMKVALLTGEQNSCQAQIDADNLYMSQKASIEARTKVS